MTDPSAPTRGEFTDLARRVRALEDGQLTVKLAVLNNDLSHVAENVRGIQRDVAALKEESQSRRGRAGFLAAWPAWVAALAATAAVLVQAIVGAH